MEMCINNKHWLIIKRGFYQLVLATKNNSEFHYIEWNPDEGFILKLGGNWWLLIYSKHRAVAICL